MLTLDPALVAASGWQEITPQAPSWWNEQARTTSSHKPTKAKRNTSYVPAVQEDALFDVVSEPEPAPTNSVEQTLAERVVASDVYGRQAARAGRGAPDGSVVVAVLQTLLEGQGRAHRDTVAAVAGVPATRFMPTFAMLRRLLNVERYEVIGLDPDQQTVVVDTKLLSDQFEVGSAR